MRLPVLRVICAAVSLSLASTALALPGTIKQAHPRLYANQADLDQLNSILPAGGTLPAQKGTVQFTISGALKTDGDGSDPVVFGTNSNATNAIMVRHVDSYDAQTGQTAVVLQVGFIQAGLSSYAAHGKVTLQPGVPTTITLQYDTVLKQATLTASGGTVVQLTYPSGSFNWTPAAQRFDYQGRRGDVVTDLKVLDGSGAVAWQYANIDYELGGARKAFLDNATGAANKILNTCQVLAVPPKDATSECDVATAGRNVIFATAKKLALAHKLTADPLYLNAAVKYVQMIEALRQYPRYGVTVGIEWSMNARVAALGVIYDWFYDALDTSTRATIRAAIRDTIRADIVAFPDPVEGDPKPGDDLIAMICGSVGLAAATATLDCAGNPDLSRFYITGHHASAMTGAVVGLLAIAQDSAQDGVDVMPLIDRIYTHLVDGIIPAREYISVDGGHQTMYAYNATVGEIIERLIMWRRAITPTAGTTIAPTTFEPKVVRPYIYALRSDGTFPAGGDNFDFTGSNALLGYMSLAAATQGDGIGTAFYEQQVKARRAYGSGQAIWDQLYFPGARAAAKSLSTLPLSQRYRVAGNVFMRDSWDYANSTLLDFKSTSFISENHQHLDQNSFGIFRHAPLLLDTGVYDAYNSAHWDNYYRRTIAHNSVVVFDPAEQFVQSGKVLSNDGGQWFKTTTGNQLSQERYPTLAEVQPSGRNALDGVTHYEEGGQWAFVTGNASKAYSNKLDQADGFLRSIFYLRPAATGGKTTVLVFDRVHTVRTLATTSLLHTAGRPETHAVQTAELSGGGRFRVPVTQDNAPLVVRNGGGMLTIEPLLPKSADIVLAGGDDGASCDQIMTDAAQTVVDADCRFTARKATGNGQFAWYNFGPNTVFDKLDRTDFGAWRTEITSTSRETTQWFLNALHVEDVRTEATPTVNSTSVLDSSDGSAAAVRVAAATTVVFAKAAAPAASVRWKAASNYTGTILVAGLQPQLGYTRTYDNATQEIVLTVDASPLAKRTSREGILSLTIQ